MADDTPRARGRRPPQGEPVLDRAFRLLECFGPANRSLSLAALSDQSQLPKATTLRLARKLVEHGALERTDSGEYVIGLRLLGIASLAPRGHGLRATALPYLEDLHHATGQHVLLAVRDGHEAVLIERLSARGAGRVAYRVGGRMPLPSTGVGVALLAHAPRPAQDEIVGPNTELRTLLAAVRRDGFAVVSRLRPDPMTSIAAPILDGHRTTIAALSVVTRSENVDPAALSPAVVAVARAISRATAALGAQVD
ncbi:IclR family transcriptional regulator [Catenulispora sp. NL8]|uniref:IclR family transcriptional regulator n=1 Tax=Catenulispora pinistramenti TaxID=2705254 RepID=A0ABS5KVA8_9ACTN|nr:IclR family transcriptional regulator [Catenulispora pinistramenti]MBS2549988.1 IclR family transcriptional regulator [Catenulispora pinistramenti]